MEGFFESELKGQNGCRIYIVNSEGKEKEELACILVQHGQHVQLTIDEMCIRDRWNRNMCNYYPGKN